MVDEDMRDLIVAERLFTYVELAEFLSLTDFDFDLHGNSLEHIVVFVASLKAADMG